MLKSLFNFIKKIFFSFFRKKEHDSNISLVQKQDNVEITKHDSEENVCDAQNTEDNKTNETCKYSELDIQQRIMDISKKERLCEDDLLFLIICTKYEKYSLIVQKVLVSLLDKVDNFCELEILAVDWTLKYDQTLGIRMLRTYFDKINWRFYSVYSVRKNLDDIPIKRIIVKGLNGDSGGMFVYDKYIQIKSGKKDVTPDDYDFANAVLN